MWVTQPLKVCANLYLVTAFLWRDDLYFLFILLLYSKG